MWIGGDNGAVVRKRNENGGLQNAEFSHQNDGTLGSGEVHIIERQLINGGERSMHQPQRPLILPWSTTHFHAIPCKSPLPLSHSQINNGKISSRCREPELLGTHSILGPFMLSSSHSGFSLKFPGNCTVPKHLRVPAFEMVSQKTTQTHARSKSAFPENIWITKELS